MSRFKLPLSLKSFSTHLKSAGPLASRLKSRSIIRVSGPDSVKFLQGLLTNDVRCFGEPVSSLPTSNLPMVGTPPVYAAMLNPQGRFLYDFFIYRPPRPDEKLDTTGSGPGLKRDEVEVLADVDGSVVDEVIQTLQRYRLRSKVDIDNASKEFDCWQRYGGNLSEKSSSTEEPEAASIGWGGDVDKTAVSSSRGNEGGWEWFKDPRLDCLGFRGIFPSSSTPPLVEADKETDEDNYLLWRLENGVAEGSTEIPKEKAPKVNIVVSFSGEAIPLEYNLAGLNAISFEKGCYVGQELIARTHHRGVIRKRLLPLKFVDDNGKELEQKVAARSVVVDPSSGKKVGTVATALGSRGLGLLRLDEALRGSSGLVVEGNKDVNVKVIRPKWWPTEWFLGHQDHTATA